MKWKTGSLIALVAATALHAPLAGQDAPAPLRGSSVVTGQVIAADTRAPVPSVNVELLFASDSLQVGSAVTGSDGRFRIERMPEGTFFVRLTSVGYGTVSTEAFEVAEAETRNLGELPMDVEAIDLEPLTVSVERTVVTYEADRTSYNVGVMPGTEGASVTETLATIPELEVDIDGRITLRNSSVTIYINGREAPMSGDALAIFLEHFPADYLQNIEILDNPSARYDAEGTGGIVNLVMKEGAELGVSGSVFADAGTRGQYGLGGRGTFQRGGWTLNGGGFLQLSESSNTDYELRQNLHVDPTFLRQDSWSDRSGLSSNVDLELEFEPSDRSQIYAEGRVSSSGDDSDGLATTTHLEDLDSPILAYERSRASDGRDVSFDLAAGFEHGWEPGEQELEVEFEFERQTAWENSREEIEEISEETGIDESVLIPAELTIEDEDELETELQLQADYVRGWGDGGEIELGYEVERTARDDERLIGFIEDPINLPEGVTTDRGHEERELSHSLYTTVERRFGDLSVELGVRAEYVDLRFELPGGEEFGRDYMNVFPSANVSYPIDGGGQLRLSYSRRVDRPDMSVLNPINSSTDPLNRQVGNLGIEPEFTHSVSINASWDIAGGSLGLSPYYRASRNGWAPMTTVDEQGISTRTYQNLASNDSYGASLTYSLRQRDGWRGDISVSARRENRNAGNLDDRYSGSSLRFSSEVNLNGRITEHLSAQGNFSYDPPTDLPQGRVDARYEADFGVRLQMLDDRGSVRLSLEDPFGLRGSSSNLRDVDYILIGRSEESTRSAQISVSWALGGGGEFGGGDRRRRGGR